MTITEALAEIKTLEKRIQKKRDGLPPYILRRAIVVDPLESQGGSKNHVARELQAIGDLENRIVQIRTAIQRVNLETSINIEGMTKTIAEWLTWRKEIAPKRTEFLGGMRATIVKTRDDYAKKGGTTAADAPVGDVNVIVNVDEAQLIAESDKLVEILGALDGLLSLKNATIPVPGL